MPEETTVLLVDAHHFHTSLEAQLSSRQVYVEHATSADAVQIASVLVPDLIVVSGKSGAGTTARDLSQVKPALPIIVVADRAHIKKLKVLDLPLAALVPHDLPAAAIAHRISTLARKSAQGELVIKPSSRLSTPEIELSKPTARSEPSADKPAQDHKSGANKTMIGTNKAITATRIGHLSANSTAKDRAGSVKNEKIRPKSLAPPQSLRPAHSVPAPSTPAPAAGLSSATITKTTRQPSISARANVTHSSHITGQTTPGIAPEHLSSHSNPPKFKIPETNDELSVVAQLPIDLRLPLSSSKKPTTTLRLTLLDTDLTRADLLTGALRRKGLEVFPVAPDVKQTRWPLLRRFAPQALIVDEKGMSRGSADWVETFRGDPFLRHVPLIVLRYSRLFSELDHSVDLEPLLTQVEHLGKDESALLEKLAPGRQVDLKLAQIGPVRLLQLLTEEDRNTRIDCRAESERIVWPLGPGYAGKAKLLQKTGDKVLAKLSPNEAFSWLLRHEILDVAVHEHTEPLAHASESEDSAQLLRTITDALGIPERHESLRPTAFASHSDLSIEDPPDRSSSISRQKVGTTRAPHRFSTTNAQSPQALLNRAGLVEPAATPSTVSAPTTPTVAEAPRVARPRLKDQLVVFYGKYAEKLTPISQKLRPGVRPFLAPVLLLGLAILMSCLVVWVLSGPSAETAIPSPGEITQAAAAGRGERVTSPSKILSKTPVASPPSAAALSGDLWAIAPDSERPNCEEVVGNKRPSGESQTNAQSYLRQARKLLMTGNTNEALQLMCLSGLSDDTGLAAESLAEYYLGQRSLMEAQRWVEASLKADPQRRKSQELLADVESQKGNWEESRRILLKTMRLTGSETATLGAIGRKLVADARQAFKGGDVSRAERELRRAAVLVPESGGIALELANLLSERKMNEAALLWSERAYVLDPTLSAALVVSGRLAADLGKIDTAKNYFQRVPPGDPYYQQAAKHLNAL